MKKKPVSRQPQPQPKTYDIEEYRRKKKRKKLQNRFIRIGAVVVLLGLAGGGVYLYDHYDIGLLLKSAKDGATAMTAAPTAPVLTTSFPVSLDGTKPLEIKPFGGDLVLLTTDEVALIDKDGKTLTQFVHGFTNPVIKTGEERVLTYDRGGYAFRLDSRQGNLFASKAGGTILTGAAGHGSVFALVTTEARYAGSVTVYNKSGEELLKWSSAEQIVDVDFSPDDNRLAVSCVSFQPEGGLAASLHIFDIKKEKELASLTIPDSLPISVSFKKNGSLHVICDNLLGIVNKDLKTVETISYARQLQRYATTDDGTLLITSDNDEVTSTITLFSAEGKSVETVIKANATDGVTAGDNVLILTSSEVLRYDETLTLTDTYPIGNDVFRVALCGAKVYSLSAGYLDVLQSVAEKASSQPPPEPSKPESNEASTEGSEALEDRSQEEDPNLKEVSE